MEEPICKLCKGGNKATKKNSHILPSSLIREGINYQGSSRRDKEAVYSLSTDRAPTLFTGREMLPDQIQEVKQGFENVAVEEENSTTEDYIFCPNCEQRFSLIENYFSEQSINFLKNNESIFSSQDRLIPLKPNHNSGIIKLYIMGLFWRASISTIYPRFSLAEDDEELLRLILDGCMDLNMANVNEKVQEEILISSFPIIIIYSEELDDSTKTINHLERFKANSYLLLTNRFGFLLFSGGRNNVDLSPYLYGINQFTQDGNCLIVEPKPISVVKIFKTEWQGVLSLLIKDFIRGYIDHKTDVFKEVYKMFFNQSPNILLVEQLKEKIFSEGANVSDEQLIEIIASHFESLPETQALINN